jgi:hypothetical protein
MHFLVLAASFSLSMFFRTISSSTVKIALFFLKKSQGAAEQELIELVPNFAALQAMLGELFVKASLFVLVLWLLYSAIQGIAWHILFKIREQKIPFWHFMKRFTVANFVIFLVAYLIIVMFGRLSIVPILEDAIMTQAPALLINVLQQGIILIAILLLSALLILAPIIYTYLDEKRTINTIYKRIKKMITSKRILYIIGIYLGLIIVQYLARLVQNGLRQILEQLLQSGAIIDFGITFMYYVFALALVFGPYVYAALLLLNVQKHKAP